MPRIAHLKEIDARVKFLSCEPLLEDLGPLDLSGIQWVIAGGESGTNARPMDKAWVLSLKRQCEKNNVLFFFKQWGMWGQDGIKRPKKENGRLLLGHTWDERPAIGA